MTQPTPTVPPSTAALNPLAHVPQQSLPASAVELGRIAGAWGVRGWLKIHSHSADAQALLAAPEWFIQTQRLPLPVQTYSIPIAQARWHGDTIVAHTPLIADRDAAQALQGARIFVLREHFPPPAEGEFYWVDLIGLRVQNPDGTLLGQVVQLLPTGPQTTLIVRPPCAENPREQNPQQNPKNKKTKSPPDILIPFVDAWIDEVNITAGHIITSWNAAE